MAKKIPYGLTDYLRIVTEDYYYVDKTRYIEDLEKTAAFLFLIRPRRFGKSLFLNMLYCYYDVRYADKFDELFGNQYIGKHPTSEQGKYLVLYFNFSAVRGTGEALEENFNMYAKIQMEAFADQYASYFEPGFSQGIRELKSAASQLNYIGKRAGMLGLSIYLLIDEYDNFTNTILSSEGNNVYRALTHDSGFYRGFFNIVKAITTGPEAPVKRMFITGVSPVTLDDVTSGFNIGTNITTKRNFNDMVGFSESELQDMLSYYQKEEMLADPIDEIVRMMKPWYDNYCFSTEALDKPSMYNSDMVLYFMNRYLLNMRIPNTMLDANIRTDYNKLRHLIRVDKTFGENASVVQEIVEKGATSGIIADSFPAENIIKTEYFKSLLYYYGMLTINGTRGPMNILSIPNQTVREQLYGYMIDIYKDSSGLNLEVEKLNILMYEMAYEGDWNPYFEYIVERLNNQSSIREFIEGEAHVKAFILAYLGLNSYYIARPEYESNKGYADIFLHPRLMQLPDMAYSYCIEVKYAKRDASDAEIKKLLSDAKTQLKQYAASEWIRHDKGTTELKCIALVFQGWKLVKVEEA